MVTYQYHSPVWTEPLHQYCFLQMLRNPDDASPHQGYIGGFNTSFLWSSFSCVMRRTLWNPLLLWFALFITWIIYFYYVSVFQQCLYIKVYINLLCIKWIIIFLYHISQVLNTSVVDEVLFLMDCNNVCNRDVKLLFNPFSCILCIALV